MAQTVLERRDAEAARKREGYRAKREAEIANLPALVEADDCVSWAEANIELPGQSSAIPGPFVPWKHQRTWLLLPFAEDGPRSMVVQKCARAGWTKCLVAIAAYGVATGSNVLLIQPRWRDAVGFAKDSLIPVLENTFGRESHIGLPFTTTDQHIRITGDRVRTIKVLHGVAKDLKRVQAKIAGADELASFPHDIGGDGGLQKLLAGRLRESKGRFIGASTPRSRGSVLEKYMGSADLAFAWYWSCPSCQHWQAFDFDTLDDEARLPCKSCGELHTQDAVIHGDGAPQRWQALDGRYIEPDGVTLSEGAWPRSVAFRINALAIPSLDWADLKAEDKEAKTIEDRRVIRTEILGLPFGASGRGISAGKLYDQRQHLTSDTINRCRVMGVDVQSDRIVAALVEWDEDERAYVLDYTDVEGFTDQPGKGAWPLLGALVDKWKPLGGMCDSGFRGDSVFHFCRLRFGWRPIKGTARPLAAGGLYKITTLKDKQVELVSADVGMAKHILYDRLSDEKQTWFHFNKTLEEDYFHGLLAEELRLERGRNRWVKLGPNEALDCTVYAFVCFRFMKQRLRWRGGGHEWPEAVPSQFVAHSAGAY